MSNRPKKLDGFTVKTKTGYGNLYVTINEHEGKPIEIFTVIGKSGNEITAFTESLGRLVSLLLQSNVPIGQIIKQLEDIGGERPQAHEDTINKSIPDALGKILKEHYFVIEP